jgi:hypothetical protein
VQLEGKSAGLEAELRITGIGRFFGVAFLGFWLVGWAVGEAFALWILGVGAWSLLTGQPPEAGREPFRPEFALPVGLFLLFWLSLWTLGGVMAGRELLRLLFGRDRIRVGHDTLEIEHSYGLFRSREKLQRNELRRFYRRPGSAALCVETARGTTELTRLGTTVERADLEQALNAELQLVAQPAPDAALPDIWCETASLERDAVLVKNPAIRRKQAISAWAICALLALLALYVVSAALRRPELWGLALILVAIAALVTWGAVWLSFGRNEWRLEKGRLILQRRFGANRTTRFQAVALELLEDSSGEGDPSYQLAAVAADAPQRPHSHSMGKHRRVIHSQAGDPTEPRKFGQWLSQRCQLPFADQTTPEAKAQDLEALMQQLANSGRLGRAALCIVKRLTPPRTTGHPGKDC